MISFVQRLRDGHPLDRTKLTGRGLCTISVATVPAPDSLVFTNSIEHIEGG